MDSNREWLKQSSSFERDMLRKPRTLTVSNGNMRRIIERIILMTPVCRMIYSLLESSLVVGDTLGATPESHSLAEVIPAFSADTTLATWNANL